MRKCLLVRDILNIMKFRSSQVLYQALFYTSWMLAVLSTICNIIAIVYIIARRKQTLLIRKKKFKFDEIILLSLCFSNLVNSVMTSIDCTMMMIDIDPYILFLITSYGIAFTLLVSLINVLVFAMERVVSFRFPFFHRDLRRRYVVLVLALCWTLSALPTTQLHRHRDVYFLTLCGVMVFSNVFLIFSYFYIFTVVKKTINNQGVIPPSTKTVKSANHNNNFTKERTEMHIKTTIMCLSIVITYFLCTVPPAVWMIMNRGVGITHREGSSSVMVMYLLLILRTLFDPLVYILRNKLFNISMIVLNRMRFMWKESSVNHHSSSQKQNDKQQQTEHHYQTTSLEQSPESKF